MNKTKREPKRIMNFRLSDSHRDLLKLHADGIGVSMTEVIRCWIDEFIRPLHP